MAENKGFNCIGKSVAASGAWEKATGRAQYVPDMKLPGMLYGKMLRSPYAHARIVNIDTSKAEALEGVKAVATIKDTPQVNFGPMGTNEDWYIFAKDKVRFIGDEVAAVAAIDEATAEAALDLIEVTYEELPAVFDMEEAMKEGSPVINEKWPDNIASQKHFGQGDIEAGFAEADLIVEEEFYTNEVYQSYMETMCALVRPEKGSRLTMWVPIQIANKARLVYAKALGISPEDIRLIKPFMGGGFGAKFETNIHLACAVLARKTGRPVKMINSRHEDFAAGNPRVPIKYRVKMGFKKDGTCTAKYMHLVGNNGCRTVYGPAIMSTACYRIDALYKFPNVKVDGYLTYTNTVPTGCFRGFGNAQSIFMIERMMDIAAEKLGLRPEEIRKVNAMTPNFTNPHGWRVGTCGLTESIDAVLEAAQNRPKTEVSPGKLRGIGMACCNHVSGNRGFFPTFDGSSSLIRIAEDGKITVFHGECDMGQGQDTVFAQIAAEELGAKFSDVRVAEQDSQISPWGLGSYATRGTTVGGNGIIAGCKAAKKILFEEAGAMLGVDADQLDSRESIIFWKRRPEKSLTFSEVGAHYVFNHAGSCIIGNGYYRTGDPLPDPKTSYGNVSPAYIFGCHMAEVEIDTLTGHVDVVNYWAAHDSGRPINPTLLRGQIEGGIGMGLGWALWEDMIIKDGKVLNDGFLDYRIPGTVDMPRMTTIFIETDEPNGPFGAKGIGEAAINPVAPAIVNAVCNALGVHFNELPVTPARILAALKTRNKHQVI
mgnify:FL=1|jgi:CO/xanthine dehydrogenase Mo-binding subunit